MRLRSRPEPSRWSRCLRVPRSRSTNSSAPFTPRCRERAPRGWRTARFASRRLARRASAHWRTRQPRTGEFLLFLLSFLLFYIRNGDVTDGVFVFCSQARPVGGCERRGVVESGPVPVSMVRDVRPSRGCHSTRRRRRGRQGARPARGPRAAGEVVGRGSRRRAGATGAGAAAQQHRGDADGNQTVARGFQRPPASPRRPGARARPRPRARREAGAFVAKAERGVGAGGRGCAGVRARRGFDGARGGGGPG